MSQTVPRRGTKSERELRQHLENQIGHLRRSLSAFQQGVWPEAERLAAVVSILVRDKGSNFRSLLGRLGLLDHLRVPSVRTSKMPYVLFPVCAVENICGEHRYIPLLMAEPRLISERNELAFTDWWNETIYTFEAGSTLSRKQLTESIRDQDGGAHVDNALTDEAYKKIKHLGSDRIIIGENSRPQVCLLAHSGTDLEGVVRLVSKPPFRGNPPIPGGHWAAMAHIAWELDLALADLPSA